MSPEEQFRRLRDVDNWDASMRSVDAERGPAPSRRRRSEGALITSVVTVAVVLLGGLALTLSPLQRPQNHPGEPRPTASTAAPTASYPTDLKPWDPRLAEPLRTYAQRRQANRPLPAVCRATQLRTWAQPNGGGALGTFYQGVFVRNTGGLCTLDGAGMELLVGSGTATLLDLRPANGSAILPEWTTQRLQIAHSSMCATDGSGNKSALAPRQRLSLKIGVVTRDLGASMRYRNSCNDLGFSGWFMTDPEHAREPGFATPLRVSLPNIADPYRGGPLDYTVTITNRSLRTVHLPEHARFLQMLYTSRVAFVQVAHLGAKSPPALRPGAKLRLRMHIDAPLTGGADFKLGWYLPDGTGAVALQE